MVWAPRGDRLGVEFRVTNPHRDAATDALAGSPFPFEGSDHRVVGAPDGEVVTMLHYKLRAGDVSRSDLEAILDAVADALAV